MKLSRLIRAGIGTLFLVLPSISFAATMHIFERADCTFCARERAFITAQEKTLHGVTVVRHNIVDDAAARTLFEHIVTKSNLPRVTPLTVIDTTVIQGFSSDETTGTLILSRIKSAGDVTTEGLAATEEFTVLSALSSGCTSDDLATPCTNETSGTVVTVPLIGPVTTEHLSLTSTSALLGFVDGFNPCAMWVLVTFLLLLSQIKDRKKMWEVAGLFIVAEALMYNLILNVWYSTWDFVQLDRIVTPVVGIVAIGGGIWFLKKFWVGRKQSALVCDIVSEDTHSTLMDRMSRVVHSPLTLMSAVGIIGIAFSVNIIEFACSIGIPQAYTKLLELNAPSFMTRQFYIGIYTIFYMIDDIIVFALALWGFERLSAHGAQYAAWSALIGGCALLLLGVLLLFAPQLLVM
jgi:cytochrome c biogenesis protein CcdA